MLYGAKTYLFADRLKLEVILEITESISELIDLLYQDPLSKLFVVL